MARKLDKKRRKPVPHVELHEEARDVGIVIHGGSAYLLYERGFMAKGKEGSTMYGGHLLERGRVLVPAPTDYRLRAMLLATQEAVNHIWRECLNLDDGFRSTEEQGIPFDKPTKTHAKKSKKR